MAKATRAFLDNAGKLHVTAENATLSDLEAILGRLGGDAGITSGLAQKIFQKRAEIEAAFAEFDQLTGGANA